MKTLLSIIIGSIVPLFLYSQVAISYFPFQSILSISTNNERAVFAEYKLETNNFATNMNMELSPKINLKRAESFNYYIGAGISLNPANASADLSVTNGYFMDLGIRVKPLAKNRSFQVVFEISPYVNKEYSGGNLRTRLGLAWNFARH